MEINISTKNSTYQKFVVLQTIATSVIATTNFLSRASGA